MQPSFSGYLNQIQQSGDEKKLHLLFFEKKNGYHTIYVYENCMITIFS